MTQTRYVPLSRAGEFLSIDDHQVIELDPLSPWGYERRHAALHKAGDYENAINAFEAMLLKMSQLSDPDFHGEGVDIMLKFIY